MSENANANCYHFYMVNKVEYNDSGVSADGGHFEHVV